MLKNTQRHLPPALAPVLSLCLVATSLAGCSGSQTGAEPVGGTSIVYSLRSNEPAFDLSSNAELLDAIGQGIGGRISVVSTDGSPALVSSIDTTITAKNSSTEKRQRERLSTEVLGGLEEEAAVPETDLLAALALAGDAVSSGSGARRVLVIDSGLTTAGALALQQTGLLNQGADIEGSLEILKQAHALPDLAGVSVTWFGLGRTADPQSSPDEAAMARLRLLWKTVVTEAGGTVAFVDTPFAEVGRGEGRTGVTSELPDVSPVEITPVTLAPAGASPKADDPGLTVNLTEAELPFLPESAQFRDPVTAQETLEGVARSIQQSGSSTVVITGCTSSFGSRDGQNALSQQRARTVAQALVSAGLTPGAITEVRGLGATCPGRVIDVDGSGNFVESLMAQNRRVTITTR